jgi:MYXO-CTERM domain-containing protein
MVVFSFTRSAMIATMHHSARAVALVIGLLVAMPAVRPAHAEPRSFPAGSLIIPMDLAYQDRGLLQAYGLLFQLLRQGVPVAWVIDPDKSWHAARCDSAVDPCPWDCAVEGSGVKCPYPTASPDFFVGATVRWSDAGTPADTPIANHGYRGGPFVVHASHRDRALAIVDAWNDPALWPAHPWAQRTVFRVVTVHEATAAFQGFVSRELLAAPTIAVFSDGNEDIATGYLRAAGIKQSSGAEFPSGKCGASNCGPGTANPDMLTVPSVMGDMGTCDAPNRDHKNGALFTADGLPQYCQIMSMHWNVADREKVQCGGGNCPATPAQCAGVPITYHGHEVVAEVRAFLAYPTHFFAECQAVNAYENTTPNPAWPYLDDDGRDGHFLTTEGMPPACPCTDGAFQCVTGGCNGMDCCLPKDNKEKGAGFLIASSPNPFQILHPHVPYNQLDGFFQPVGGSEPAYNLSAYLGTEYKNDREVTFITALDGPGKQDVWMSGYLDGECDIIEPIGVAPRARGGSIAGPPTCASGKVSYLGGHAFSTSVPVSGNAQTQGTRLFLNALFEADCVSSLGQPEMSVDLTGPRLVTAQSYPVEASYSARYSNLGAGAGLDAVLRQQVGAGVAIAAAAGATIDGDVATWTIGSISGQPVRPGDPAASGARASTLRFTAAGDYQVTVELPYRVGLTEHTARVDVAIRVRTDRDGDGVPDEDDPFPDDPNRCGDSDQDGCDDCASGTFDPDNDGCEGGGGGGGGQGDGAGGCCQTGAAPGGPAGAALLALLVLGVARRRRA